MIRGLLLAAGVAALVYTGVIYNSAAIIILAFCSGGLLLLSYLYAFYMLFRLKCRIQIPISMTEQGSRAWVEAVTDNPSRLQAPKLRYAIRFGSVLSGRSRRMTIWTEAGGKETSKMAAEVICRQGGCYRFRLRKVRVYGWFGIVYVTKYVRSEARLDVMPEIVPLNVMVGEASRHFMGEAEIHDDKTGGDDVTEVFQIRPFRDGDRLQSIHWKLSAKEDELMVKENSLPLGCPVVVLLDMGPGGGKAGRIPGRRAWRHGLQGGERRMSRFFTRALSLSFALTEQKCNHYIAWFGPREQDVVRVRVDREEKVYYALLLLYGSLGAAVAKERREVRDLYQEKYRGETWITEIVLSASGGISVNGEIVDGELSDTELRV